MAVLVLLAATAGAGVVAADLLLHTDRLGDLLLLSVAVRLGQQVLALLADLRLVDALRTRLTHGVRVLCRDVGTHQEGDDVLVDVLQHGLEQVERLEFVDDQRVFLLLGGVLHRLLKVVEFEEVFLPGVVDEAEGDALLDAEVHLTGTVLDSLL